MKKLPEVDASFRDLYKMMIGPIKSKLMLTSIELGVFNNLNEPKSANALAKDIGTHPENTRLFLDGLTACGLLEKKKGLYQNTPISQTFLVEGSPTFLGKAFTHSAQMWHGGLNSLPELVKKGPPPSQEVDMGSEEIWAQFAVYMANYERAGAAQLAAKIASGLPEFQSFEKMLDLGGGPGLNGIAIVAAHKNMKGVIFDRLEVVKVASNFIKEYGMEDRMEILGGDYNKDSIGTGYDLIFVSAALNSGKDIMSPLMKKIYNALDPGGVFISSQEGLTYERTKPDCHVLGAISMALMGQDMCFDQGFIADSILKAGFKSVSSRTLDTDWGPMDMDIGRKQ